MSDDALPYPATRAGATAARRHGIARFYGLTALGTLVPGAGLLAAGKRLWGGLLLGCTVLVLALGGYYAWRRGLLTSALDVAVQPTLLRNLAIGIGIAVLIWCASIIGTAVVTRPSGATGFQKVLAGLFATLMCLLVVAPTAQAVRYMGIQRDVVQTLFTGKHEAPTAAGMAVAEPEVTADDPWANTPRVNVLLLGSDSGKDRIGVRTDSMIVASIDTKSGDTTLFGVPRNLQNVPFPEHNPLHELYPNGYNCGNECLMNAVWMLAETHKSLFPGDSNPGLTTTRDVLSEVLGLRIDNTVIIDLAGFKSLVDAMGGVTVNVQDRIPIGGEEVNGQIVGIVGWIEKGTQHLDGFHALWYSRSRATTDDYSRMRRQRCMVGALISQVNPVTMLQKYPELAAVAKQNVQVDISQNQLPAWVELVQRMQKGTMRSLPFTSRNVSTSHPDFDKIRELVADAVGTSETTPKATSTPTGKSTGTSKATPTGKSTAVQRDELVEVSEAC